ncbi:MAG: hypothetical protein GXP40_11810 [Chloroflexi bacterium]|nr:hypothetical protein [Chloroflexota bacterium]
MPQSDMMFEMAFSDVESFEDWIKKVQDWIAKAEGQMEDFEVSSITLNIAVPPSASITIARKGATILALPAS